ncbi:COG4315 family predicted lipoprotein [Amycolatopsis sp. CA-161197]|uniref:COG4315 family predicted lipoprotein n=1 Tax=Amycolatopsis sp. CA-161197 TaxID=3239922 RepID=UPI003D910F63
MRVSIVLAGAALLGTLAACGSTATSGSASAPEGSTPAPVGAVKIGQSSVGPILTDSEGRTLYAFADDKTGTSTCESDCLATWPALTGGKNFTAGAGADQKLLTATERTPGVEQAKYGVWPLYYYVGDQGPGDIDGQGVDNLWFVVGADGKLIKKTP